MMTFTEAAVHVLRLVGKPLHYKEITDVAIEKDLLSHVGKSPEVTMGARLAAVVKKGGKDNLLARVKPGVFALAEWTPAEIEKGLSDRTPALERMLAAEQAEAAQSPPPVEAAEAEPEEAASDAPFAGIEEEAQNIGADEKARAELSLAATQLFEPEEDDDEPILGAALDEEDDEDEDPRRRRGRRRGRRGRERDEDGLPSYTVSDAPAELATEVTESRARSERPPREEGERREGRDREGRDREGRDRDRERDREGRDRDREGRDRDRDGREREPREGREEGLEGIALIESCLSGFRRSGAVSIKQLCDALNRRNGKYDSGSLAAAMRADNLRRSANQERQRFRFLPQGRVALVEWGLDREALQFERTILSEAERLRQLVRKQLLRRLAELPHKSSSELWLVLLERLGYDAFKPIKRPNAHASELHYAALHKSAGGEVPVAIVVRRDGRDVGRERVTELRGSLHHYGPAALGVIVTTGQVMSGAREEANAPFATPVAFIDGAKVAELCERHGVGVVHQQLSLPALDTEWLESLRSGQ